MRKRLATIARVAALFGTARTMLAAAALLAPAFAHTAYAEDANSYPRIVGGGENASVEYGPGPVRNIVGGGFARVVGHAENLSVEYYGPVRAQPPLFAHVVGSDENMKVVYGVSPDRGTALAEAEVLLLGRVPVAALAVRRGNRG